MIIGVTDTLDPEHKYKRYIDWLKRGDASVECRLLSYVNGDEARVVDSCDAIVLTGGHDVDPALYGGSVHHPKLGRVDRKRDDFERSVLDRALAGEKPVLGICRGLQIANVHFGGTLLLDLEESGYQRHRGESGDCTHAIAIAEGSMLRSVTRIGDGNVNSSHHQAVAVPGPGLRVVACSTDSVIEAMERTEASSFFLLVQWHPERMEDFDNPLSRGILNLFIQNISASMISEYQSIRR
jgi:putative glutamine amidotransferase